MSVATGAIPRRRVTPGALLLLALVVVLLVAISYPLRALVAERSQIAELERQVSSLEDRNADLRGRIADLHDPGYIERLARECLGMVRPGEIAFVTVPEGGEPQPPAC